MKLKIHQCEIGICSVFILFLLIFGASSTSGGVFANGRHVMEGRTALLNGDPKTALTAFEAIAQSSPNYINCAEEFCVGIWTYLGRTQHELAENQKALESLKKGKGLHARDRLNRVYLGLVMALTGQSRQGKTELDAGLKSLHDWLSGFAGRGPTGQYWDPGEDLQKSIANIRNLLQGDEVDWEQVDKNIHSLAVNLEQEARDVRNQKDIRRSRF